MNISVKEITSVDKEVTLKANREELQPKFDKATTVNVGIVESTCRRLSSIFN